MRSEEAPQEFAVALTVPLKCRQQIVGVCLEWETYQESGAELPAQMGFHIVWFDRSEERIWPPRGILSARVRQLCRRPRVMRPRGSDWVA